MTRSEDGKAPAQEDEGTFPLQHLANRDTDPRPLVGNPTRHLLNDDEPLASPRHEQPSLRVVSIEPSRSGEETPTTLPNRVILAFARLVREALEAEDEATQQGA